jgi:flavodoxin I
MAQIGLFYGTETGNTRKVAKMIAKRFDDDVVELYNVANCEPSDLTKYNSLIVGTPTLGDGELENSWVAMLKKLDGLDFTGKKVAIYGLGDQVGYAHEFVDAMIFLYKKFKKLGASIIGSWPTDGYEFDKSKAVIDGQFLGLVIDQDNQKDLTKERIDKWLEQIRAELLPK